ncbi:S8 family serine peptidase [Tychonema sp. LEGE 07199]|uniref:S8 family serine peptidase n=1 Tax=Tychonema sp. LEGE 07199 TaxID=1828668 RepID=UPI001880B774|nr:S8 family serine peptidase [Tychonema sp. LEGE 07199]MBE9121900.1 S8 family serine peptidase [Tychonema sp. LEGE 07199]
MSTTSIGNLKDNYFSIDFAGKTDPTDTYRFDRLNPGSFRVTAEGFSSVVGMQLLDSQGKVVKDIETDGTNSGTFSIDNLGATNYALKISAPSRDTNYQVSLTPDGKVDPLTGLGVTSGFFTADSTGQVGFDWLHDGGNYQGEVAVFSVQGMENFDPRSEEFIKESARRALSNSLFGHVVISDPIEGANPLFNGSLGEENYNGGQYSGPKTFLMKPGEAFAVMLVPNGTVQDVFNNPGAGGDKRPLLSLSSLNPDDAFLSGQIADVTGKGKAFAMEDQRVDTGSDKDYNDLVFNLTGATGKAVSIDKVIDPAKDWTKLDGGKKLIDYVASKQPVQEPPVAVTPPVETTPPVAVTPPVETTPPVAVEPPSATIPPVEPTPPVAVEPPSATIPPVELEPPVAVEPPSATIPPVEPTPPVAVEPPSATIPPVEPTPPVAVEPPMATIPPVEPTPPVAVEPPMATIPPVEPTPPVAVEPPSATIPPVEPTPPVAVEPPSATIPPVEPTPPVAVEPPSATIPPVEPTPPVAVEPPSATIPPVEQKLPVERPIALAPPIEPKLPVEPPAIDSEPPIETVLPISSPAENRAFIGIFDTGFAPNNPDLDYSKVTMGRDRIDKDSNPLFTTGTGNEHGTFSWGLVSAIQGNDKGVDGYNDKANVYLSRAIGSGEWDLALTDFVGEAKAQKQKNAIALLPLDLTQKNADGSITTRYEFTPRERAALENARQNGVLLVVAAGNDGGVMSVLGQSSQEFENILTVGSSDGFGRSDYSSYGYGLDILVPGGTIDNPTLSTVGDDIGTMSGTSASAAKAAGMASKVWEANPDLNPTQIIDILTGSAIDLKEPGWDQETGFGVVNFNKAVAMAKDTKPQSYTPSPFITPITWDGEGKVTPMERATQNWNQVKTSGRTFYHGSLDDSNPSDVYTFTVNQPTPLQFGTLNIGSATLKGNGIYLQSAGSQPANANTLPGGQLPAGTYTVTVDKGSLSKVDSYTLKMNFYPNANGSEPYVEVNLPEKQTQNPPSPPVSNPFQIVGEIGKEYQKIGGESRMGKPLQNQVEQISGVITQVFEKGSMIWNGSKVATVDFGGVKAFESFVKDVSSPAPIPSTYVDISKNWKAEVYKWDRGSELQPPGKLSDATPTSKFLGSFNLGSNSKKELKFDWGKGSPNGNSQFPADNFVIKTYTDADFEANKTYKFSARGDDGFRLFARPLDKPDAWELITPITDTSINPNTSGWWQEQYGNPKQYEFKSKESGKYRVVALFYDRDLNANFDLSWKDVAPPVSPGSYYPQFSKDDSWWDAQTGDNIRFDGNQSNGESTVEIKQIYAELSTSILGSQRQMNAGYLYDQSYYNRFGKWHSGIDFKAKAGDPVKAAVDGKIVWTDDTKSSSNGYFIAVEDKNGKVWVYGHLQSLGKRNPGDQVKVGDQIGTVGSQLGSNAHFHLAVGTKNGSVSANADQNLVRKATMSPLEAYWLWKNS